MWMVVGMASGKSMAGDMQDALQKEGMLVKLRPISERSNSAGGTYEIIVLESEADASREILLESGF